MKKNIFANNDAGHSLVIDYAGLYEIKLKSYLCLLRTLSSSLIHDPGCYDYGHAGHYASHIVL